MDTYNLFVIDAEGQSSEVVLSIADVEDVVVLRLEGDTIDAIEARADGGWDALVALRLQLEARGLFLGCHGSRRNVYPSPMSLDMGGGERAYQFTLGVRARTKDLVSIWDRAEAADLATVEEQERFYDQWLESI